ncbi:DMT family transporter [Microlunatus parietis]|uniref:Small multidrug resistance pump n=1 Tax=Microlunatus parietis TaxID=682979 RepID=A0A7Y9LE90_9ACTN|nr:SMR family transporter [Microlunatus parietis]NYE73635.1 small multidrug resistance pump [Microlunatus parietis]
MSWLLLLVAIGGDVAGTVALDRVAASRRRRAAVARFVLAAAAYLVGLWAFAQALRSVPTAIADAVFFSGATAVIAVVGVVRLGETVTLRKVVGLALIIMGVSVLRLGAGHG